jgi:transposase-like protein
VDTNNPRICGKEFAMAKRKRRSFTPEFKAEAVQLCLAGDRSWVREVESQPAVAGSSLTSTEQDELKELRKRVKRLEVERDILKKAAAFFAKENT